MTISEFQQDVVEAKAKNDYLYASEVNDMVENVDQMIDHAIDKAEKFLIRENGSNFEVLYGKGSNQAGKVYKTESTLRDAFLEALKGVYEVTNKWTDIGEVNDFGAFMYVWYDGATYHGYYTYTHAAKNAIGHCTSNDGTTWTEDVANNPVLTAGGGGAWDETGVAVLVPWKEGANWYAVYRGTGDGSQVGLATSADGVNWTKEPTNPIIDDGVLAQDPSGIIKVGGTYYLFANSTSGDRCITLYTSTDLTTWTRQNPYPLWRGIRYCCHPFKYDGNYYMLISRHFVRRTCGVLELWKSSDIKFTPETREFVGIAVYIADSGIDCPSVVTDTIGRDTFPNNELWVYFSGDDSAHPYLTKQTNIATALLNVSKPQSGIISLCEGEYTVTPINTQPIINACYDVIVDCEKATLKLVDNYNTNIDALVYVRDDAIVKNLILDGNDENNTGNQSGVIVTDRGFLMDITVKNFSKFGFETRANTFHCKAANCLYGFYVGDGSMLYAPEAYGCSGHGFNILGGIYSRGIHIIGMKAHDNTQKGVSIGEPAVTVETFNILIHGEIWNNGDDGADLRNCVADIITSHNTGTGATIRANVQGRIISHHNTTDGVSFVDTDSKHNNLYIETYNNDDVGITLLGSLNVISCKIHNEGNRGINATSDFTDSIIENFTIRNCVGHNGFQNYMLGSNVTIRNGKNRIDGGADGYCWRIGGSGNRLRDVDMDDSWSVRAIYDGTASSTKDCKGVNPLGYNTSYYSDPSPDGSPFTWTNQATNLYPTTPVVVYVSGGTVSQIEHRKSGGTWVVTGLTSGAFYMEPHDEIKITYTGAPTMKVFGV